MTRLPHILLCAGLAAMPAAVAFPVTAQTTSADSPATDAGGQHPQVTTDWDFVRLATSSDILEIRSSELARDNATSEAVRAFAERMIADHTAATQELAQAADTPPPDLAGTAEARLDPLHAEQLSRLQPVGGDFDSTYLDLQRKAHEDAVALFQDYATNGQEGAVKNYAAAKLPKLQEHLQQLQQLRAD